MMLSHTTTIPRELAWITSQSLHRLRKPPQLYLPLPAGLTTPFSPSPPSLRPMDDRITFPLPRVPAVLPHPEDLMVTLTKDESVQSFPITTHLTPETIPNSTNARAALHAVNRLRQTFTSPFGTPDSILDRPTWLRMILETLAGIHEGFKNAQLISPDADLPKSFHDLNTEELNTVARIFEVTSWLQDFCEAAEDDHDHDHISPFCTVCIWCIESANLPPPCEHHRHHADQRTRSASPSRNTS
jgi:hypothetical protein